MGSRGAPIQSFCVHERRDAGFLLAMRDFVHRSQHRDAGVDQADYRGGDPLAATDQRSNQIVAVGDQLVETRVVLRAAPSGDTSREVIDRASVDEGGDHSDQADGNVHCHLVQRDANPPELHEVDGLVDAEQRARVVEERVEGGVVGSQVARGHDRRRPELLHPRHVEPEQVVIGHEM